MKKRVVITGMGAISPVGQDVETFWDNLSNGRSGLADITRFDITDTRNSLGGEVKNWVSPPEWTSHSRAVQFALCAARQAVEDAGLSGGPRVGCCLSTNFGGTEMGEAFFRSLAGEGEIRAGDFAGISFSTATDLAAREFALAGPQASISLSCASGVAALGFAMDQIRLGRADAMLAGGYDELALFSYAGLCALRAVTPDTIRPFDLRRKGTIFSEGAGVVVLESLESAQARGAIIYAEVLGHAMNNDAFHMTAPDKEGHGIHAVMSSALKDAGINREEIDHINAHGTGTPYNDRIETSCIKHVFGDRASKIPVVSVKSEMGHTMGAAGTLEVICAVKTIQAQFLPPTINLEEPDPECDLDYVPGVGRPYEVQTVLSNSYGIGGTNAAVILRKA
ncbi:MAG: beta-ketoacyl-[acyl-carrier-protein] synthase family protein [Planctomycetota bacterium]|nr:beta-ketoacyl-[acyl-carrier-protein] synthase family protein [Planctomycetota bacterium]MDA1139726.1 beta-ketoacyl-[acyl-carrier-protein] synthase family protein [Planctomycetota bacterium]